MGVSRRGRPFRPRCTEFRKPVSGRTWPDQQRVLEVHARRIEPGQRQQVGHGEYMERAQRHEGGEVAEEDQRVVDVLHGDVVRGQMRRCVKTKLYKIERLPRACENGRPRRPLRAGRRGGGPPQSSGRSIVADI